jgi:predicted exporter
MRRRRLLGLVSSFALLGLCAVLVALIVDLRTDLSFVFPRDPAPDTELLAERLQRGPAAGLILIGLSGAAPEALIRASNRLAEAFEASGRFRFVANGRIGPAGPGFASLFDKRYLLNPPVTATDFAAPALRERLQNTLESLGTSSGVASKRLLPADPTGRLREIAAFWKGGSGSGRLGGVWLSRNEDTALMMVQSTAAAFDLAAQEEVLAFMRGTFDELNGGGALHMDLTGPSVFATASSRVIRSEMRILTVSSALLVMALLYAAFRSLPLLAALVLPLGFGICAGAAAVQLLFDQVHGVTLAFGGTLIGVAVDYPIHLISHAGGQKDTRPALRSIWRTLRLGVLTTITAFLPITLSNFPGLSQLGLFAIVGLAAAALVTRTLLPAVLPPATSGAPPVQWGRLTVLPVRRLRLALLAVALVAAVYIGARGGSIWETDLRHLSPTPAEARALDRRLRTEMGAADVRYLLVVRASSMEEVLRRSEALAVDLEGPIKAGQVGGFDMASRYLPSLHSQQQRRLGLPDRPTLRAALKEASAGLPFRPGLFEPFLDGVAGSKSGPPLTLGDFDEAGLGWRLEPLVFRRGGGWVGLIVPQGVNDPGALADFVAAAEDGALSYLDLKEGSESLVADYRREALAWLALGAAIAVAVLFLGLRSAARVFRVMTPVGLSVLLTVAVLSLSGIAFSLFHLLSLLLVGGVGLDYALFFDRYARDGEGRLRTLRANVLCAATSVMVFTILAFSQIPVLHGIGTTVAVGTVFSLFLAFVFAEGGIARK